MAALKSGDVARRIADGYRLAMYLDPDPSEEALLNSNDPYIECYPLPHVCAAGDRVWGATRATHTTIHPTHGFSTGVGFSYSPDFPIYCLFYAESPRLALTENKMTLNCLPSCQYRVIEPRLLPPGALVWTDAEPDRTDLLARSIQTGSSHRIVFKDESGILRSHPLDLAFLYGDNRVEFSIEQQVLPASFTAPEQFEEMFRSKVPNFDVIAARGEFSTQTSASVYASYRKITGDGRSQSIADVLNDTHKPCRNVTVYSDSPLDQVAD